MATAPSNAPARPQARHMPDAMKDTATGGTATAASTSPIRIEYVELASQFRLPFPFQAYLMRGAPVLDVVLPHLSDSERGEAQVIAERSDQGRSLQQWMLSRIAIKRAASELMASQYGVCLPDHAFSVVKTREGAPILEMAGASGAPPAISISHARQYGLGAAAQPGVAIGIDFELPENLRDPSMFAEAILNKEEQQLLGCNGDPLAATIAWSLKEAAAKALGTGIQGQPMQFRISAFDGAEGSARIEYGSTMLWGRARLIGNGVCAIAYPVAR